MDNQQLSISEFELGWLAGIIDGEGCIGLWSRGGDRRSEYKPGVRMSNTCKILIDKYCNLLTKLNCSYHVVYYKPRSSTTKEYWTVSIEGLKRTQKLLPIISDKLVSKYRQASLVQEWCEARLNKWHRSAYDTRELEIPELLSKLNHRGVQK